MQPWEQASEFAKQSLLGPSELLYLLEALFSCRRIRLSACLLSGSIMAEVRAFMNEDAYYKVLKAFAAGAYDLVRPITAQNPRLAAVCSLLCCLCLLSISAVCICHPKPVVYLMSVSSWNSEQILLAHRKRS